MYLNRAIFENYRNIDSFDFSFDREINILYGKNAQGKTNVIEGIYLFGSGKSFRHAKERDLIRYQCDRAQVGIFYTDSVRENRMDYRIFRESPKEISKNGIKIGRMSGFIGNFKSVLFCPEHLSIVKNEPAERRGFLDGAISQFHRPYLAALMEYKKLLPIVYYGNSVTQGGCASRPGNSYPNIIGRRLNVDFINLGFSGSGKAEETMVDYLASLDMSVFVCDYDHNAPNPDYLKATHCNLYEKIRAAHPQLPIIIMSKCDFVYGEENSVRRRDIIYETFRYAKSQGDKNVYFMDGASIYSGDYANIAVIDRVHPSDIGFSLIADTLEEIILRAINNQ